MLSLVLSMVLLGGSGTIYGPIVAAFAPTSFSVAVVGLGLWRFLIIPAAMILVLVAFPGGLASLALQLPRASAEQAPRRDVIGLLRWRLRP